MLIICLVAGGSLLSAKETKDVITLDLTKPTVPAEITYSKAGYWAETYNDQDYPYLVFSPFKLSHVSEGNGWGGVSWDGFTISVNGDDSFQDDFLTNQWGCMAGGGIMTAEDGRVLKDESGIVRTEKGIPYAVAYWSSYMETPGSHYLTASFNDDKVYEAMGVYVCNHPWPYHSNRTAVPPARKLDREGDYFKLIIGGVDENGDDIPVTVDHYLARFDDGELIQSVNWEWIDLSLLGKVKSLFFTMESTDIGEWGMNTATYFCLDKLQVRSTQDAGTDTPLADSSIRVYPIGGTGSFGISASSQVERIEVVDLNGKRVWSADSVSDMVIPASGWVPGVYTVKVWSRGGVAVQKIIK